MSVILASRFITSDNREWPRRSIASLRSAGGVPTCIEHGYAQRLSHKLEAAGTVMLHGHGPNGPGRSQGGQLLPRADEGLVPANVQDAEAWQLVSRVM